jgi:MinD-like ATPase involved in chromosome partitioning or flagellar assembly
MKRIFAFVGGRARVGQSTIAAELALEWGKRGARACILTTRGRIASMGFDSFTLSSLAPPPDGGPRDLASLAADLGQLEDYDYIILDLPPESVDLAIAAGLSGAQLVVPLPIEEGPLHDISAMFQEMARRPPLRPLQLVLNKVRNAEAALNNAERLIASMAKKLKLPARLAATLPWDPELAALEEASPLVSATLPTAALVQAMPLLAEALDQEAASDQAAPVAMVFWEQFQTLLQQLQNEAPFLLELTDPVAADGAASSAGGPKAPMASQRPGVVVTPALTDELARIAGHLEQLGDEVRRLRRGLARKLEFEDDAEEARRRGRAGKAIRLDFDAFRRSRHSDKA